MQEIAPGIFLETAYPPYNVGLITLDNGAIAVDVPLQPVHARAWLATIEQTIGKLRHVILTDTRPERLIAAAQWKVPIIAAAAPLPDESTWRAWLHQMSDRYPAEASTFNALKMRAPALTFNNIFLVHRRTPPLTVEATPGTVPGSVWVSVPDQHVLFGGDSLSISEPPLSEIILDLPLWLQSLEALLNRTAVRWVVPGRGTAPLLRSEVAQTVEFIHTCQRIIQVVARKPATKPHGLAQTAQDLGQTFFNAAGQKAVRRIKGLLEQLLTEARAATPAAIPAPLPETLMPEEAITLIE